MDIYEMQRAKVSMLHLKLDEIDEIISMNLLREESSKSSFGYIYKTLTIIGLIHSRKYQEKANFAQKLDDIANYYRFLGNEEMGMEYSGRADFFRKQFMKSK
jgi:hypothetical protein